MIQKSTIINPKRNSLLTGKDSWYPYYAGYSSDFVATLIKTSGINKEANILDPWNGSGTTTTIANSLGYKSEGYDLNPVMVIAAKACLVSSLDYSSLVPLSKRIVEFANDSTKEIIKNDSLTVWLRPSSANYFRQLEKGIQKLLVSDREYFDLSKSNDLNHISSIASFFYLALFRSLNYFLSVFRPTNPTWIKLPKEACNRRSPTNLTIEKVFLAEVESMYSMVSKIERNEITNICNISLASSCHMPTQNASIDLIITSPPYCTRIDYAVATMPELTLLNYDINTTLDKLRRSLIGASTVPREAPDTNYRWGRTCNDFLDAVYNHRSKASQSYYYKSHVSYFDSMFNSIIEIERVLKKSGTCFLVVQDSHYKEIFNNLPQIINEMCAEVGLELIRECKFPSSRNMAKRNPGVKKYRPEALASESVICFKK